MKELKEKAKVFEETGSNYYTEKIPVFEQGLNEIKETEYTPIEVHRIEKAFEEIDDEDYLRENPMPGLLRAISVLGEIHKIPDDVVKCVKEKVENDKYKFSHKFSKGEDCPIIKPL